MIEAATYTALGAVLLAMLLQLLRLLRGPGMPDRVLALDALNMQAILLIVLLGIRHGTTVYLEAGLVIAMLGFVTTVALGKYLLRRDIIE